MTLPRDAQLQAPSVRTRAVLFALIVPLPLLMASFDPNLGQHVRYGGKYAALAIIAGGLLGLWGLLQWVMRRQSVAVDAQGLTVTTSFYRRQLAWNELDMARMRVVDLDEHTELKAARKTNAMAVLGFKSGWFRLRNGNKALLALQGDGQVLWLPTRAGYDLLLEPVRARSLLQYLTELAASSSRA